MKNEKSIYSVVLDDEVVAAIDKLAYMNGTNRSGMINGILAEYASLTTPEKRMREIFSQVESMLDGGSFKMSSSQSMMSLGSALAYKYNPTVKYGVELYRSQSPCIGKLKVSLRTQNEALVMCMNEFYKVWSELERKYTGITDCRFEDGKLHRPLTPRKNPLCRATHIEGESAGKLIADYIRAFDTALKEFFKNIDAPKNAVLGAEKVYREYLAAENEII